MVVFLTELGLPVGELIDLVFHVDIVADRDVAAAEKDLDASLFQRLGQVLRLLGVQEDSVTGTPVKRPMFSLTIDHKLIELLFAGIFCPGG